MPATWFVVAVLLLVAALLGWLLACRRAARLAAKLEAARAERARAQDAAHAQHVELERRVVDRTAELAGAIEALKRERRLFVGGPVTVFRWTASGGWPVEYVSPNVINLFGYTADEFITGVVPYARVVHPEDLERVGREVAGFSQSGAAFFEQDYRIVRHDGKVRWLYDFTIIVRDAQERITHYEGYVLDVTDRMQAETERARLAAAIQHGQKLESLGVLAGGIAHDFNNLLVGILGHARLVLSDLPEGTAEHAAVRIIETSARRAAELTRQMLAYSGKGRFVSELFDLSALVREMAELLEVSISKKAAMRYDFVPDLPPLVGDPGQIRQVVMNLITNASDALGDGTGAIDISTGQMEADRAFLSGAWVDDGLPTGTYVWVQVADTGCGMDAATLTRIFDPFFSTKFTGRGLGLAAVLGIVRSHHGAIRVESSPGMGTTIRVLLPPAPASLSLADPAATTDPPSPAPRVTTREGAPLSATVLVVDDEELVRTVACTVVERAGGSALTASDGEQALQLLRDQGDRIDCILLDLTMPTLGGVDTLAALHELLPDMPVILTSGYSAQDALSLFKHGGPAAFLQKPFTPEALIDALQTAIRARPSSDRCSGTGSSAP